MMKQMNKWAAIIALALVTSAGVAQAQEAAPDKANVAEAEEQLRAAEARLREAAREVAELNRANAPSATMFKREFAFKSDRARLGIGLGGTSTSDPSESKGVKIASVSPASPAAVAGVKPGDVLVAIKGTSLAAANSHQAYELITEALAGLEDGDSVALKVERDGKLNQLNAIINSDAFGADAMSFGFAMPDMADGQEMRIEIDRRTAEGDRERIFHRAPNAFMFFGSDSLFGSTELVKLTPELGSYFGTDSGLLVVRSPDDESIDLKDGDVIRRIGDREPTSVNHALRILRSYEPGESVELEIMRDMRKRKITMALPQSTGHNSAGWLFPEIAGES